jgi:hypothetical protein
MEMSLADAAMTRDVVRDIVKHPLDISELQVHAQHGVIYLSGRVRKMKGYYQQHDLREDWNVVLRILKQKSGIRDVICEVELEGSSLEERVAQRDRQRYHH